MIRLTLGPDVIRSANELLRMHHFARHRFEQNIGWELRCAYGKPFPAKRPEGKATLRIWSYRVRLLDHDNLFGGAKHLIDQIKHAHFIRDDSPKWCQIEVTQEIDRMNPRTEIEITEAKL